MALDWRRRAFGVFSLPYLNSPRWKTGKVSSCLRDSRRCHPRVLRRPSRSSTWSVWCRARSCSMVRLRKHRLAHKCSPFLFSHPQRSYRRGGPETVSNPKAHQRMQIHCRAAPNALLRRCPEDSSPVDRYHPRESRAGECHKTLQGVLALPKREFLFYVSHVALSRFEATPPESSLVAALARVQGCTVCTCGSQSRVGCCRDTVRRTHAPVKWTPRDTPCVRPRAALD
mmetsp:Transcript_6790/g.20695  ORF Transcript_6790/g.20695 Transcript_6790/m.20695 type:complete len:228 (+) Transcript_6790:3364-4047(+)